MSRPGPREATEHHIRVERTARYWTLGEVAGPGGDLWFVLHGYKQLARRFLRRFTPIARPGRLLVAPEALSRFYVSAEPGRHGPDSVVGATWMTREDRLHEIGDYVAYLDRLAASLEAARHDVTVLGFSQGVATATRWVVHGAVRPRRLILWGDLTPPDLDMDRAAEALAGVEVTLVRGDADPAFSRALVDGERERLARLEHRLVLYEGGHDIDAPTLRGLASR